MHKVIHTGRAGGSASFVERSVGGRGREESSLPDSQGLMHLLLSLSGACPPNSLFRGVQLLKTMTRAFLITYVACNREREDTQKLQNK